MAYIISADELKKSLPGYDPAKSGEFHRESTRLADREYTDALANRSEKRVVLMAGGAASGKSEYVSAYLGNEEAIVLDGTLPTLEGASIKIRAAQKAGKEVEVHVVLPADFKVAFVVFLNRERKFASQHFYDTHIKSRKSVLEIAEQFPLIPIKVIESNVKNLEKDGEMEFGEIEFPSREYLVDFLRKIQYSQSQIEGIISHDL